ncbi:MAG TPA: type II and III secretion system protein, partial [Verrucomicrobiales bacterium]|nr:type II and III secretion system protein [Verrucomicrobiales bacterium]
EALNLATSGVFHGLNAQIKALVREGKAEVLSRPSVLALNNRMAFINVSKEIPVANTTYAPGNNYQRTSFEMKKAGISLAVRPRASADGSEVSMQINAMVTAQVPNEDVEVKQGANVVAKSPTISVREVKTTARVANNTPFIIGGLIARDKQSSVDKVPLLGDLPLIGGLFRSKQEKAVKREVIIVLTPTVLPDNPIGGKHIPKDEDSFDSFGNQLFRDAYRIRAEDTFDLNYLTQNRQLQRMKALASHIVAGNVQLSEQYPYNHFVGNAVPGEEILCYRQIYEVLKRQKMQEQLASTKIIFFEPDKNIKSGHRVRFLEEYLRANAPEVLTEKGGAKAVAISFTMQRFSDSAKTIFNEPVPELKLVECADEANWARQLWALNQPTEEGQEKFTVLLRHQKDLQRLKYAVLMKKTVKLNTEKQALSLSNFTRGRLLLMPRVKEADIELVDGDVARAFFFSEMYYQALQVEMEKDLAAFRKVIEDKNHLQQMLNPNPRK